MDTQKSGKTKERRQIFTFFVEDMMFGLNIDNVLMLGQDIKSIQRLPIEERGFCGVTKLQGTVVPVLNFAHRIGFPSGIDVKNQLIDTLTEREKDHIEWLNALEQSLEKGVPFTKQLDPELCAFGQWYKDFDTRDETLKELLVAFDEPHKKIHSLAEILFHLRDAGKLEQALEQLQHERATTLRRLRTLFSRAREQIRSGMRQVLLFVTTDGKTPRYALLVNEIHDVIDYLPSDYQSSNQGSLSLLSKIEQVIDGIYTRTGQPDCLYFDIDKLTDIDQLMSKVS